MSPFRCAVGHPDSRFSQNTTGKDVCVHAPLLFNIYFSAMLPSGIQQYASIGADVMKNMVFLQFLERKKNKRRKTGKCG